MKAFSYLLIVILLGIASFYLLIDKGGEPLFGFLSERVGEHDEDDDDDETDDVATKQQLVHGSLTVKLSTDTQKLAGIKTVAAEHITVDAEDKAFATVIDIKQLIDSRSQYRNANAALEVSRTEVNNASVVSRRLEKLNAATTNISTRELQQARADLQKYRAKFSAEKIKIDNIRAEMLHRWNPVITEMALQDSLGSFDRLINQQDYLVLLSLRPEQSLSNDTEFAYINRVDERHSARKAYVISPAPFSEMNLQGETYFLRTSAEQLRIGMRLHAWLPGTGYSGTGIRIPDEAVVWYAGKAWTYVQVDEETFSRRSLPASQHIGNSWLVNDNFATGDQIVISGAQTLLSEEFKWAIPDEDDD